MAWNLESQVDVEGYSGATHRIQTFSKHGLLITFCLIPGPLCSFHALVPTDPWDDSGLPHTLEHLIFCGSKTYPEKGFLDNMANRALASGTNAYTAHDHTCYTMHGVSFEGLCHVLPIYLDHILNPVLNDTHFPGEVYNAEDESGVVYSEMKGIYKTEDYLLDRAMREMIYGNTTLDTLVLESGGLPDDIKTLNMDKIRKYHRHYYTLSKLSIVILGPVNPQIVLEIIDKQVKILDSSPPTNSTAPKKIDVNLRAEKQEIVSRVQNFTSGNTSIGSMGIGFLGPSLGDTETLLGLEILGRYLCGDQASPMYQWFVESNPSICSSVDFDIHMYIATTVSFVLSGIEADSGFLNESAVTTKMQELFKDMCARSFETEYTSMDLLRQAIVKHRDKHFETLEENPHDLIYGGCLCDIMLFRKLGVMRIGSSLDVLKMFKDLENRDAKYWADLIQRFFMDTKWNVVVMVPIEEDIEDKSLEMESRAPLEDDVRDSVEFVPDSSLVSADSTFSDVEQFPHSWTLFGQDQSWIHLVKTTTAYVHMTWMFDLKGMDIETRKYLVLFQEMLFDAGLRIGDEMWTSKRVVETLNRLFLSCDASVGFRDSTFSSSHMGNVFVISTKIDQAKIDDALSFLFKVLSHVDFDHEKLSIVTKNLLSECIETERNGWAVLNALQIESLSKHDPSLLIDNETGILHQKPFLSTLVTTLDDPKSPHIQVLRKIRDFLFDQSRPVFVQIGHPNETSGLTKHMEAALKPWTKSEFRPKETSTLPGFIQVSDPEPISGHGTVCGIGGITTTHCSLSVRCDVFDKTKMGLDFCSVLLMSFLLSRTEGPLYSLVRGNGLAYGASISLSLWKKALFLSFYRASDVQGCILRTSELFAEIDAEIRSGKYNVLSQYNIDTARSTLLYRLYSERMSPSLICSHSRQSLFRGFQSVDDQHRFDQLFATVQIQDVVRVYQKYFKALLDPAKSIAALVCPLSEVEQHQAQFSKMSISLHPTIIEGSREDSGDIGGSE